MTLIKNNATDDKHNIDKNGINDKNNNDIKNNDNQTMMLTN